MHRNSDIVLIIVVHMYIVCMHKLVWHAEDLVYCTTVDVSRKCYIYIYTDTK